MAARAAVRAVGARRAEPGVRDLSGPAQDRGRHQHRRDQPHHPRHRLRDRLRPGQGQLVQYAHADRRPHRAADLTRVLQPAPRARRSHRARHLLPAVFGGVVPATIAVRDRGDPSYRPVRGGAADGGARHHRVRGVRLPVVAGTRTDCQRGTDARHARCARRRPRADRGRPHHGHVPDPAAPRPYPGRGDVPLSGGAGGGDHRGRVPVGAGPVHHAGGPRTGGAPRPPRISPSARRPGCVPGPVRPVSRQQRPGRLLRAPLSGAAHHVRDPQRQGAAGGDRERARRAGERRRSDHPFPVRRRARADSVHLRCRRAGSISQSDGRQHLHPPRIGHVPATGALHRGGRNHAHGARLCALGIAADPRTGARHLARPARRPDRGVGGPIEGRAPRRARPRPQALRRGGARRPAAAHGFEPRRRAAVASARAGVRRNGTAQQAAAGNPALAGRRADRPPRRAPLAGGVSLVARSHYP